MIFGVKIEVDQPPVLQKGVNPENRASIARYVPSAGGCGQVGSWVLSVHFDDVIPDFLVALGRFGGLLDEELR